MVRIGDDTVKPEQLEWAEGLPNDGEYEYTSTGPCDGSYSIRLRRTPRARIKDGMWVHTREYGQWESSTEEQYQAACLEK